MNSLNQVQHQFTQLLGQVAVRERRHDYVRCLELLSDAYHLYPLQCIDDEDYYLLYREIYKKYLQQQFLPNQYPIYLQQYIDGEELSQDLLDMCATLRDGLEMGNHDRASYNYMLLHGGGGKATDIASFISRTFYLGKGTGSRYLEHFRELAKSIRDNSDIQDKPKIRTMKSILFGGQPVVVVIFNQVSSSANSTITEASLLRTLGLRRLTNKYFGSFTCLKTPWTDNEKNSFALFALKEAFDSYTMFGPRKFTKESLDAMNIY